MFAFTLATFLGAFLLFQVQPIVAKVILPWFGGTPSVWTVCMLFFQTLLLLGYSYAYLVVKLPRGAQAFLHALVVLVAIFLLPSTNTSSWVIPVTDHPTEAILLILFSAVGLPYTILATTGPLMQAWFHNRFPSRSPYALYALSNAGSLAALLTYPILVEPALTVDSQLRVWSGGFFFFAAFVIAAGIAQRGSKQSLEASSVTSEEVAAVSFRSVVLWIVLAAAPSILLLALTNHVCQDLAVVPFLWIAPLTIYLLSFIFTFSGNQLYSRKWYLPILLLLLFVVCDNQVSGVDSNVAVAIFVSLLTLFVACMACHGELYRAKPHPSHLTTFYLMVSFGGALGGIFVGLIAPRVFVTYAELHLGLFLTALALVAALFTDHSSPLYRLASGKRYLFSGAVLGLLAFALGINWYKAQAGAIVQERNFFGIVRLLELATKETDEPYRAHLHGRIVHGIQFLDPEKEMQPTAYYGPMAGSGMLFARHKAGAGRKIAVTGLGAGTIASLTQPNDELVFYEINPLVLKHAEEYFSFLQKSPAAVHTVLGDARLSLEHVPNGTKYDIFVLDAFSGDAVPTHLLTKEAFELYMKLIASDGVIAMNITNKHLDLKPVVKALASHFGLDVLLVSSKDFPEKGFKSCDWIIMSANSGFMEELRNTGATTPIEASPIMWSDKFSNIYQLLK